MTLKVKVLSAAKWVTIANLFRQILGVISLVIYARLLSPSDFGIYAILMIFVGFLGMFTDMGTSAALVHLKRTSEKLFSSVFYFNIFIGIVLFVLLTLLSMPISIFFNSPEVKNLLPIIAINFIIVSFGVVQKAQYEKSMSFKNITIFESVSALIGISMGIISAIYGLGVYSLIVQVLVSSIILVILMWFFSKWRPLWYFSIFELKKIWLYTIHLSSFNIINYFARNADNFLIGKFLGSSALGVYSLAYKIMLYPLQNISNVLIRILFPAFSQIQDNDEKFKKAYLRVIFFISLITFPLMLGLMSISNVLVDVLFGNQWTGLSHMLIILAPIGMIQSIVTTVGSIFMAKGNTKEMFKIGMINSFVTVLFFSFGIPFGVEGVALSYLLANLIMLYPNLRIAWQQIGLSVKEGVFTVMPIFIISLIMSGIVNISSQNLDYYIKNQVILLITLILIGIISYGVLIRMKYGKFRVLLKELKS